MVCQAKFLRWDYWSNYKLDLYFQDWRAHSGKEIWVKWFLTTSPKHLKKMYFTSIIYNYEAPERAFNAFKKELFR